jgi:hypothetical protein
LLDDQAAPVLSLDEQVAQTETQLEALVQKLKQLKAKPGPATAVASS